MTGEGWSLCYYVTFSSIKSNLFNWHKYCHHTHICINFNTFADRMVQKIYNDCTY